MDGMLPAALVCTALGLALAFAERRGWGLVALVAVASLAVALPIPFSWHGTVDFGCWLGILAALAAIHLPSGVGPRLAIILSLAIGACAGLAAGSPGGLAGALPCVLVLLPARWIVRRRAAIVVKTAASWLVAIALLAATLQLLPVTPGYLPDHLE